MTQLRIPRAMIFFLVVTQSCLDEDRPYATVVTFTPRTQRDCPTSAYCLFRCSATLAVSCCSSLIVSFASFISFRSAFTCTSNTTAVSWPESRRAHVGAGMDTHNALAVTGQLVLPVALPFLLLLQLVLLVVFGFFRAVLVVYGQSVFS